MQSCVIIGIAGGSGSGKSTFTGRIKDCFQDEVSVIYHDNYYKSNDGVPFSVRQKENYDHPGAFETDLLIKHLKALRRGEEVESPVYDFSVHNRTDKTIKIAPRRIMLVEGILVLENPELRSLFDIKIYVEPTKATADIIINSGMNDVAFDLLKTKIDSLLEKGKLE